MGPAQDSPAPLGERPFETGADTGLETRYDRMVDCAPMGMHFYRLMDSGDLIFTGANPAADTILGVDNGRFVGMTIEEAFPDLRDSVAAAQYRRLAREGGEWETLDIAYEDGRISGAFEVYAFQTEPGSVAVMFADISERKREAEELQRHRQGLREIVEEQMRELTVAHKELGAVVTVVSRTVEIRDPYTAGHQQRVAVLAQMIARQLQLDEESSSRIAIAASLHDLGKISIPSDILTKPSRLSEPEYAIIMEHPAIGHEILADAPFDWPLADVVLQHHERIDGSGYPNGLKGEDIHLWARVLAVADVVEAMSSHRPYRPALGVDAALEEVTEGRERLYCGECVDACISVFEADFSFD